MGHATAEAVVRAGLTLVPFSFTGESEAVVVGNVAVSGIPVQLIGPEQRQKALEDVLSDYKDLIVIDFTLPQAVNGEILIHITLQNSTRMSRFPTPGAPPSSPPYPAQRMIALTYPVGVLNWRNPSPGVKPNSTLIQCP